MVFINQGQGGILLPSSVVETHQRNVQVNNLAYATVADSYAAVTQLLAPKERENIKLALELLGTQRGAVADFGCGFGRDSESWLSEGMDYHGLDCCPEMLAVARKRAVRGHFSLGDMLQTSLDPESVLIAWFSSSLQEVHSGCIGYILGNAVRGLKSGGILYANYRPPKDGFPKEGIVESGEYSNAAGERVRISRAISHYTRDEMVKYFRSSGLEVLDAQDYDEIYHQIDPEKAAYLPKREIIFGRKP